MLYITIAFNRKQPKEKTNVEARYYKFECRKDIQYINNTYIVYQSFALVVYELGATRFVGYELQYIRLELMV